MTTKQLESLVNGIKKPTLKSTELKKIFEIDEFKAAPQAKPKLVTQGAKQIVPQTKPQGVPQEIKEVVPQAVAQPLWVVQEVPKTVQQNKQQAVPQNKEQLVPQEVPQKIRQVKSKDTREETLYDKQFRKYQEAIYIIPTVEGRKRYCFDIGYTVSEENRGGKHHYLFGIKKFEGKKYKLYIGNSKKI